LRRLPMPDIGRIEISNSVEPTSLDNRGKPYASHLQKYCRVKMYMCVAWDSGFKSTYDLFAIRGRNHGLQVVRHGDDGEQHRNQNQVRDPHRGLRVNAIF
jgi:hypothetical protein